MQRAWYTWWPIKTPVDGAPEDQEISPTEPKTPTSKSLSCINRSQATPSISGALASALPMYCFITAAVSNLNPFTKLHVTFFDLYFDHGSWTKHQLMCLLSSSLVHSSAMVIQHLLTFPIFFSFGCHGLMSRANHWLDGKYSRLSFKRTSHYGRHSLVLSTTFIKPLDGNINQPKTSNRGVVIKAHKPSISGWWKVIWAYSGPSSVPRMPNAISPKVVHWWKACGASYLHHGWRMWPGWEKERRWYINNQWSPDHRGNFAYLDQLYISPTGAAISLGPPAGDSSSSDAATSLIGLQIL